MTYQSELILDLRQMIWDERLWKRFVRRMKRRVCLGDCAEMGVLCVKDLRNRNAFETQVLVKGFLSEYLDKYRPLDMGICDVRQKRVALPLVTETESNTYLFYSTRLAMLRTNSNAAGYLMRYFLDLRLFYNEGYANFLFFEEELERMLVLQNKGYREVCQEGSILDFVRRQLCEGFYVNVHLDEFYIQEKDYYGERHFVHENLIYGFDDEKQVFYAYGMAGRQQTVEFLISYEEFLLAFEKGKLFYFCGAGYLEQEGYYPITIYQISESAACEFSEDILFEKLSAFLNPPENEQVEGDIHIYGKNVYDWILQDLTGEHVRNIVDYRVVHLLYEHKCCIRSRLEYLRQRGELSDIGQKILTEMKGIINDFQKIRFQYLQQLKKEGKLYSMDKMVENSEVKTYIAEQLGAAIKREESILGEICEK